MLLHVLMQRGLGSGCCAGMLQTPAARGPTDVAGLPAPPVLLTAEDDAVYPRTMCLASSDRPPASRRPAGVAFRLAPTLVLATVLALSACGGGAGPAPGGNGGGGDDLATRDEQSFASAWVAHSLLGHLPYALRMAEQSACSGGGSVAYDSASGVTTLTACRLVDQPELAYSGSITTAAPASGQVTAAQVSITNLSDDSKVASFMLSKGLTYSVAAGAGGDITVNWDAPGSASLDITLGSGTRHFVFSNVASSVTRYAGTGASFTRTSTTPAYGFTNGSSSWQFNGLTPIHEAAGASPDAGSFTLLRQGAAQTLSVSLQLVSQGGASVYTISFSGGEDNRSETHLWSDSDILSALTEVTRDPS
jgi:hypothetical protein